MAYSEDELITAINVARANEQLQSLKISPLLDKAANNKLQDITRYQYWSHTNPKSNSPWYQYISALGYRGKVGENLARGYRAAQDVVLGWLNSPGHRRNLLNPNFTHIGIAIGPVNYESGTKEVVVASFGNHE